MVGGLGVVGAVGVNTVINIVNGLGCLDESTVSLYCLLEVLLWYGPCYAAPQSVMEKLHQDGFH